VLTLTDTAATEIRSIVTHPQVPDDAGVRITGEPDGALTLALVEAPQGGDAVLEESGARVFLDPNADQLLTDKTLDATTDPEGNLQFSVAEQG